MPNCFRLHRKADPTAPAVALNVVDEEICAHLGVPVHDTRYVGEWYDTIGFGLAMGNDWARMREVFKNPVTLRILDFMEANYIADAWAQR